jgi:hypothetical protein
MEESAPSLFFDIVISTTMLTDHMPDLYETSLLNVLEKMKTDSKLDTEEKVTTPK